MIVLWYMYVLLHALLPGIGNNFIFVMFLILVVGLTSEKNTASINIFQNSSLFSLSALCFIVFNIKLSAFMTHLVFLPHLGVFNYFCRSILGPQCHKVKNRAQSPHYRLIHLSSGEGLTMTRWSLCSHYATHHMG